MEILTYDVPLWSIILVVLVLLYLVYMSWNYGIFKEMGVKGPTPLPFIGNVLAMGRMGFTVADETWMKQYGNVWRTFDGRSPNLFIADEDMLRDLFVKKFSDFTDRRTTGGISGDLDLSLTELKGDHWKRVRNLMTPTFSAGKLKKMATLITEAAERLIQNLGNNCKERDEVDMKKVYGGYTMDVIASTAFGIETNAQRDPNDPFVKNVSGLLNFSFSSPALLIMLLAPFLLKPLHKLIGLSFFPKEGQKFFRRVVVNEITKRNSEGRDYVDFIQLMMQAHDENPGLTSKGLTSQEIIGNSMIFFLAGYDTTAAALCLLSHTMAVYPDIQEKVYDEIKRELGDESPGYDNIQKLEYLDMCVNEGLRLYPPATRLDRVCNRESELKGLHIPKGMIVTVPIWAIHHSPQYWPDPQKFDPERFSRKNKGKISPFHFLPFGYGPRNCIGMRLALLELKVAFAGVIRNFKLSVGKRTQIPPKLGTVGLISPQEMWLKVDKR